MKLFNDYSISENKPNDKFRMEYFMVFIGYTLILFIEKVIFKIREHHFDHVHDHDTKIHEQSKEVIKESQETEHKCIQSNSINRYYYYYLN